jgi:hypothetical protein
MIDSRPDQFARYLEALEQGEPIAEDSLDNQTAHLEEWNELMDIVETLRTIPAPAPDPRFRSTARARILSSVSRQAQPAPLAAGWLQMILLPFFRRAAPVLVTLSVMAFALMGAGTAYASQQALPGDLLYPVKTGIEDLRLAVAPDVEDALLYPKFAEERVKEVRTLANQGRYEHIAAAVTRMEGQINSAALLLERGADTTENGTQEAVERLSVHIAVLNGLLERVPETAQPAIQSAIHASSRYQDGLEKLPRDEKPGANPGGGPGTIPTLTATSAPTQTAESMPTSTPDRQKPTANPDKENEKKPTDRPNQEPQKPDKPEKTSPASPGKPSGDDAPGKPPQGGGAKP